MINIYEQVHKNKFLLLDSNPIDIESFEKLKAYFKGYNKVISTIMLHCFDLPNWPTLILFDPKDKKVREEIKRFSKRSNSFFVRSDTFDNRIDNLNFRDAERINLYKDILKIKEYEERWVIVLAVPDIKGQEFHNLANFRTGLINNQITQEWTGVGFSEYHLGKDKFPHKAALHSVVTLDKKGNHQKVYQIAKDPFIEDLERLFLAYGLESLKMKRQFLDKGMYQELTGNEFQGQEPTNDELELAFECWLEREAKSAGVATELLRKKLIRQGINHVSKSVKVPDSVGFYKESKVTWSPSKVHIKKVNNYYTQFYRKCAYLGIDPNGKLLTGSINKYANKEGIIFWDIFNLFK